MPVLYTILLNDQLLNHSLDTINVYSAYLSNIHTIMFVTVCPALKLEIICKQRKVMNLYECRMVCGIQGFPQGHCCCCSCCSFMYLNMSLLLRYCTLSSHNNYNSYNNSQQLYVTGFEKSHLPRTIINL